MSIQTIIPDLQRHAGHEIICRQRLERGTDLFCITCDEVLARSGRPLGELITITYADVQRQQVSTLSVADLMDENAGYEDSTWDKLHTLLSTGYYNDAADDRSLTVVWTCDDRYALSGQMKAWRSAQPAELLADGDFSFPRGYEHLDQPA